MVDILRKASHNSPPLTADVPAGASTEMRALLIEAKQLLGICTDEIEAKEIIPFLSRIESALRRLAPAQVSVGLLEAAKKVIANFDAMPPQFPVPFLGINQLRAAIQNAELARQTGED